MIKSILSIICFLGISFCQIQYGGTPSFFTDRSNEINFIQIDQSDVIDRDFAPMVFQFGNEYNVDINILSEATVIQEGQNIT